jgi:hypothetical protein
MAPVTVLGVTELMISAPSCGPEQFRRYTKIVYSLRPCTAETLYISYALHTTHLMSAVLSFIPLSDPR